jgi:N-methylhydantoinase B
VRVAEPVVYRAGQASSEARPDADPITTEVIRHGLNSAANQMKRALIRTAFSPIIYDQYDFAVALYDTRMRMLAQAPTLPLFMGTLNFCVEAAVEAVGGVDALDPGDILLYNLPYGTGGHPQDAAMVMPVFGAGGLVGYTVIKAHWVDIGGKEPYSTDTVDVWQEGTLYPGVKLLRRGELVRDIYRMALANSRVSKLVAGDVNAQVSALRTGAAAMLRIVDRYGLEVFSNCVERMFDHGETVVRQYFERVPDGRYVGRGMMDDNGVEDAAIPFEVVIEVSGSDVRVDFSQSPPAQAGPVNCPLPTTVSASRIAITMLAGGGEAPNEGHFRPIEIVTTPGTMFHALPPSPCFLYGWPAMQAIEVIYEALAAVMPEAVPACSGGDICTMVWWGNREGTGEPWADGYPHPIGQGGHSGADGSSGLLHHAMAATRSVGVELWESKNPWILEKAELAADSGGAGRHRGGLGLHLFFEAAEDQWLTSALERTKTQPWGLRGGLAGSATTAALRQADGSRTAFAKVTRMRVRKGATVELSTGGGGGYGDPAQRSAEKVLADVREGYLTGAYARTHYPHAFPDAVDPNPEG